MLVSGIVLKSVVYIQLKYISAPRDRSLNIHYLLKSELLSNSARWRNSVGQYRRVLLHFAQQIYIPCR